MQPAFYAIAIVLGLIALSSYGYAAFMYSQGQGENAGPVITTATITLAMIAVLAVVMRKKEE